MKPRSLKRTRAERRGRAKRWMRSRASQFRRYQRIYEGLRSSWFDGVDHERFWAIPVATTGYGPQPYEIGASWERDWPTTRRLAFPELEHLPPIPAFASESGVKLYRDLFAEQPIPAPAGDEEG